MRAAARWRSARPQCGAGSVAVLATVASGGFVFYNTAVLNPFAGAGRRSSNRAWRTRKTTNVTRLWRSRASWACASGPTSCPSGVRVGSAERLSHRQQARSGHSTAFGQLASRGVPRGGTGLCAGQGYHADSLVWSRPAGCCSPTLRGACICIVSRTRLRRAIRSDAGVRRPYSAGGIPTTIRTTTSLPTEHSSTGPIFRAWATRLTVPSWRTMTSGRGTSFGPKARDASIGDRRRAGQRVVDRCGLDDLRRRGVHVPGQIAIAPGYLQREWMENGRRVFSYQMDKPILDVFSIQSGSLRGATR